MHFRTVLAALTALTLNASLLAQNKSKPSDSKSSESKSSESRPSETRSSQKDVRPAGIWYGIEHARPKQQGALRLAAYNAENLFDDFDDPSLSGEYDDIKEKTSEERLKAVAAEIRKLDADVLCLEEIESKRCLEWFRDKYLKDMGYEFVASEDVGYYRGVEQSVLSRVPITAVSIFKGDDAIVTDMESRRNADSAKRLGGEWAPPSKGTQQDHFQRSPLRVSFKTKDGYEFTVFVCHFKAGGKDFAQQRELEALQTEAFVGEELKKNPDANIAVVGDYNATPNDMATKSLRMSELGLVSAYDWRFDKDAPKETYTTHASARVIDYMIMTPGLAADCVPSSFFVLGTLHAASDWDFKKADTIPPPAGYASDHCPIAIDLMTTPDKPASAFSKDKPKFEEKKVATDAKPAGLRALEGGKSASAADVASANKLQASGWTYVMPEPKSKTAAWGNKNTKSTWYPGYWKNAGGATSVVQPTEADAFKGDGESKPKWKDGGSPKAPSFVEWLCSKGGGISPE